MYYDDDDRYMDTNENHTPRNSKRQNNCTEIPPKIDNKRPHIATLSNVLNVNGTSPTSQINNSFQSQQFQLTQHPDVPKITEYTSDISPPYKIIVQPVKSDVITSEPTNQRIFPINVARLITPILPD